MRERGSEACDEGVGEGTGEFGEWGFVATASR